mgnify:CR=1 FL=1
MGAAFDAGLAALLYERWTNNACRGYVIKAMETLEFEPEDIRNVMAELRFLFDIMAVEEADQYYCRSPY